MRPGQSLSIWEGVIKAKLGFSYWKMTSKHYRFFKEPAWFPGSEKLRSGPSSQGVTRRSLYVNLYFIFFSIHSGSVYSRTAV